MPSAAVRGRGGRLGTGHMSQNVNEFTDPPARGRIFSKLTKTASLRPIGVRPTRLAQRLQRNVSLLGPAAVPNPSACTPVPCALLSPACRTLRRCGLLHTISRSRVEILRAPAEPGPDRICGPEDVAAWPGSPRSLRDESGRGWFSSVNLTKDLDSSNRLGPPRRKCKPGRDPGGLN